VTGAPLPAEAALVARRVKAFHERNGSPNVPELAGLWSECSSELQVAKQSGDVVAGRRALAQYEHAALAAIRKAGAARV
jgi:hypothetical protein